MRLHLSLGCVRSNLLVTFLSLFVLCGSSFATEYLNGDFDPDAWTIFDNDPAGATITSVFDSALQSQVIQTQGAGFQNSYLLGWISSTGGWNNSTEFMLEWKMATTEPYDVLVYVDTNDGLRRLNYTQSNVDLLTYLNNNSISFGLGVDTMDGAWRTYERDLAADLARGEPGLTLVAVNGIMVRASLRIDDISLAGDPGDDDPGDGDSTMCEGAITTAERVLIPSKEKPPYLEYYNDPAFGSKVIRISDSQFGEVRKPTYSTMQAWNADESLLMLYRTGGGSAHHLLLDGHSYEPVSILNIAPSDLEEVFWSHTDPDTFFYVNRRSPDQGHFKRYSVSTGLSTTIAEFDSYCGSGQPVGGNDVHMQSLDDDLFGFRCRREDGSYTMLSYRISTDTVTSTPIGSGTRWNPYTAPMPGPGGSRFWFQGTSLGADLTTIEHVLDVGSPNEHSNVGLTHDGQDALYQTSFDPSPGGCNGDPYAGVGHLVEHNLETGECRSIISQTQGYPYTTSSTHVSAQAYRNPGWIAMSSIGSRAQYDFFTNNTPAPPLLSEIYLADTDPDHAVTCRLAHHRSYGKQATQGGYAPYFGEPHATISPSGTRILFGSDWYDSGAVDSYVVELPGYQRP